MGEAKEGAHPIRQPTNLGGSKFAGENAPLPAIRRRGTGRGPTMAGTGERGLFADAVKTVAQAPEPPVFYGPEKPHLERWFKEGARIYSLNFPVPRTPREAEDRLTGTTEEAAPQSIDMGNLVWSYRLKRWREQPKKEHKTKRFGAFVKVNDVTVINRRGEKVTASGLVSLNDLQKEEDNPLARFKKATS